MEQQDNAPNAQHKRQPKPEELALVEELSILSAQYGDQFPQICQFVRKEADRIAKGRKSLEEEHFLDVEGGKPICQTYRVYIPAEKYPNFNYVGRLLGPKGATLRAIQELSHCKMAILGRGSMRDKEKEEQCRQEGGKYSHLNEELHVWIQAYGPPDVAFYHLHLATKEVKKYLHANYNDDIFTEQMMMLEQDGGHKFKPRGGPMGRGGMGARGGMMRGRGGMSGGANNPMGRGGGMMRGAMRSRGTGGAGMRGGRGMHRGGARGGGGDSLYEDVYEPVPQGYNAGYENGSSSAVGGSTSSNAYFDEFPEPGTGGNDGIGFSRHNHSQGAYGHSMSGGLMGLDREDGGPPMMGMKRGMVDDYTTPSKYSRRY